MSVIVWVVACILCELPMCDAGCHGPPGRRRNRTRCTDHSDCTDEDTACLGGKCLPSSPALQCESGWTLCDGSCFFIGTEYLIRPDAETRCQDLGGRLAKIQSDARYECVTNGLQPNLYWIGGRYTGSGYQWWDNTAVENPGRWGSGLPGDIQGCMQFTPDEARVWIWVVDEDNCDGGSGSEEETATFICEKDAS